MKVFKFKGVSYYPVCNSEKSEHKIENTIVILENELYEVCLNSSEPTQEVEKLESKLNKINNAYRNTISSYDGFLYAEYKDYLVLKECINNYDIRKGVK